jgi:uncharacterized protein YjbI with pentapeptide repeats
MPADPPTPSGLLLEQPVADLARDLGIDYRSFFIGLGKAAISGLIGFSTSSPGAFGSAIGHVLGTFSAFGERPDLFDKAEGEPGKLAWILVHQALLASVTDLVRDHDARFRDAYLEAAEAGNLPSEDDIEGRLAENLSLTLTEAEVRLSRDFFDEPTNLGLLDEAVADLAQWFAEVGLPEGEAHSIANRLPGYFHAALIDEWRARPSRYADLYKALRNPFDAAQERAEAWAAYRAHLRKQVEEPIFNGSVGLRQVYIWPRAYVERPKDGEASEADADVLRGRLAGSQHEPFARDFDTLRHVRWLRDAVHAWLGGTDRDDAIRILNGDPGTGKSSFTRMLAAELAEAGERPVLFLQLHQIDATKRLREAVTQYLVDTDHPLRNTDPFEEDGLLLILDGLDELSMQGRVGAEVARDFVREVSDTVSRLNLSALRVRVLLSGRRIAAGAGASVLRRPERVFYLIPFVPEGDLDRYVDPDGLVIEITDDGERRRPVDHRDDWWTTYGEVTGRDYDGVPEALRGKRLDDITAQPLLNYLVALVYEDDAARFDEEASLNTIYEDLLNGVYKRDYDFGPHPGAEVMEGKDREEQKQGFVRVLEEIALDAWHSGDSRTTTVASIEERCEAQNLGRHFRDVREKLKTGISQLLAAFYFRRSGQTPKGEATFEFTHKSFAEYLTARRIVLAARQVHDAYTAYQKGGDFGSGRSRVDCLVMWIQTCGPTALDEDVYAFIEDETRLRHERDTLDAEAVKATFADFLRYTLQHDMPMHKLEARPDYKVEKKRARNAEEALLGIIHACRKTLTRTEGLRERESVREHAVKLTDDDGRNLASTNFIDRLQAPLIGLGNSIARSFLGSLSWQMISLGDSIAKSFLASLSWHNASLSFARLQRADLRGADLRGADLRGAGLQRADFRGADLQRADLQRANLQGADFRAADFRAADLQGANLRGANLRGANLRGVNLQRANLQGANLQGANLQGANLQGANLQGADLRYTAWSNTARFELARPDDATQMDADLRAHIIAQNPQWLDDPPEGFTLTDDEKARLRAQAS